MRESGDMDLVRSYAVDQSEEAFSELVRRHINLVYSAAMRHSGNPASAEEITQAVFVILARKAAGLRPSTVLEAWLYETTRLTSLSYLRGERRRQFREQEAYMQSTLDEPSTDATWQQLAPVLDDAMMRLARNEREAVILRFFKDQSLREVAASLAINEAAAQKRVNRAVEKLRAFFSKRGIALSTVVIVGTVSANSVQAAPVGLAATVIATGVKGSVVATSTLALVKGALKVMAWTKAKTTIAVTAGMLLAAGSATVAVKVAYSAMRQPPAIQGAWEGVIETRPGAKLRVVLKVSRDNGVLHATADSVDQRSKDILVDKIKVDGSSIHFDMPAVNGTFDGTLDSGLTVMTGTWRQPQANLVTPLILKRTTTPSTIPKLLTPAEYAQRPGSDLQGYWAGALKGIDNDTVTLHVAFKISEPSDGKFIAELDSIDQGVSGLVVSSVTYDKPEVQMEIANVAGSFEGKFSADKTEIIGTWTQLGHSQPLTLRRGNPAAVRNLSQQLNYSTTGKDDYIGHWSGALSVQGLTLRLALHIGRQADGKLASLIDSLDQGAMNIPASTVRITPSGAHLEWKVIGAVYEAKLQQGKLVGEWRQGAQPLPLEFERSNAN